MRRLLRVLSGGRASPDVGDAPERSARPHTRGGAAWGSLLLCGLIPLVAGLVIYTSEIHGQSWLQLIVYVVAVALLVVIFLGQISALLENQRLNARLNAAYVELENKNEALNDANQLLHKLATTDPLTELPNQRAMKAALDQELERGRRYGRTFTVLFIDLDQFKKINDLHGHLAGDSILKDVVDVMRKALRAVDTLGRWGGEEFIAILPEVDSTAAMHAAERIRETVAAQPFGEGESRLTASIGAASYPDNSTNRNGLIDAADRAMYTAKNLGRNQGRAADDPLVAPIMADGEIVLGDATLAHTVEGLSAMIAGRAHYTAGHISTVARLTARLALATGVEPSEVTNIKLAARLHDIGKIAVPDAILLKPGRLNDDEWMLMRRHPIVGADVVGRIHGLGHLAPMIRSHHERWDGVGYPDGLSGDQIPLGARILAVADAYDAMTQGRVYQEAHDPQWAMNELRRCAGSQFDPKVVEAMERVLATDPELNGSAERAVEYLDVERSDDVVVPDEHDDTRAERIVAANPARIRGVSGDG
jgi:diguanylate cyclase (GGDEF)-like protein